MSFGRLLTAMVTPMHEDGSVNFDEAARLARHLAETGSDGIVVAGSTGESPTLTFQEKLDLFRAVRQAVGPQVSVLAGTGTNATQSSIELTRAAEKTGVDGVMLVVPYYNKPTQEGLYRHFKAVAAATSLPVMLYNVPGRTAQNLAPATVARLVAEAPNIVAIKEASGNLEQAAEIRRLTPPEFLVYSGDDALTLPILAVGGYGVVSVAAHLVGTRIRRMIDAYVAGDTARAAALHAELLPLFKAMFVTTNPVPVKVALRKIGFAAGPLRLPLCEPTPDEERAIERALEAAGLLTNV